MGRPQLSLTNFVDVFDRQDLFEILDNQRVLELSQLGGGGFSEVATLSRATGIQQRRILRPGIAPLDLAVNVCEELRRDCDFSWSDCPAVLLCHSHVDSDRSVNLAAELADHLGLPASRVHGFNLGCAGFLKLMSRGASVAAECGPGRHVPLISVEVPEQWHDAADKAFCGIVAAGATATTIWDGPGHRILGCEAREVPISLDKRFGRDLFTQDFCEGFDFHGRPQTREVMHMDGEAVFVNGVELMLEATRNAAQLAEEHGRGQEVITIPHQPSGKLLRTLIAAGRMEMPDIKFLNNLPDFGNTLSSTIPTVLARIEDVAARNDIPAPKSGDALLLTAAGICMSQRADHMTQGYAAIEWA